MQDTQNGFVKMKQIFDFLKDISWFIGMIIFIVFWLTRVNSGTDTQIALIKKDIETINKNVDLITNNHLAHMQKNYEDLYAIFEKYKTSNDVTIQNMRENIQKIQDNISKLLKT
jgi:hypothetical protein